METYEANIKDETTKEKIGRQIYLMQANNSLTDTNREHQLPMDRLSV